MKTCGFYRIIWTYVDTCTHIHTNTNMRKNHRGRQATRDISTHTQKSNLEYIGFFCGLAGASSNVHCKFFFFDSLIYTIYYYWIHPCYLLMSPSFSSEPFLPPTSSPHGCTITENDTTPKWPLIVISSLGKDVTSLIPLLSMVESWRVQCDGRYLQLLDIHGCNSYGISG